MGRTGVPPAVSIMIGGRGIPWYVEDLESGCHRAYFPAFRAENSRGNGRGNDVPPCVPRQPELSKTAIGYRSVLKNAFTRRGRDRPAVARWEWSAWYDA